MAGRITSMNMNQQQQLHYDRLVEAHPDWQTCEADPCLACSGIQKALAAESENRYTPEPKLAPEPEPLIDHNDYTTDEELADALIHARRTPAAAENDVFAVVPDPDTKEFGTSVRDPNWHPMQEYPYCEAVVRVTTVPECAVSFDGTLINPVRINNVTYDGPNVAFLVRSETHVTYWFQAVEDPEFMDCWVESTVDIKDLAGVMYATSGILDKHLDTLRQIKGETEV